MHRRRGDGRLVLVAGEASVGKSALVEQFQADLPGARWSWGACDGLFTPRPLGPLFDLAAQLGGELEALCRAGAARDELFRALLRQLSEPGTLDVLVVEDLHWADEATVDLLRFLGRRLADAAVLLLATYREEDLAAGDPLRAALGELVRQRPTRRIELAPLSADAVRRLAGSSGLDPAELYRLTGGNPFYVTEVLSAGMSEVPAAARDAVLARAARLSDALNTEACAVASTGGSWTALMRRALEIAVSGRLQAQAGRAYANMHAIYCAERWFDEAGRWFVDGVAYCDDHDIGTYGACLRGERTGALEKQGCWEESASLSVELLTGGGASPVNLINPLMSLGKIRARQGGAGAWQHLDEAVAAADGTGEPQWIIPARLARAEANWLQGETATAIREAELADDVGARGDAWSRGAVAAWLRRTGSARPPHGDLAEPYRLQMAGDWAEAARLWTGLGCPYEAALASHDATDEAALREALQIFTRLGASPAVQLTRQKMRGLGIGSIPAGPRTATRAHPLGLTRREREVLDLICAGHTNAEIAAKLFISVKTVDHHVSAVLAKMDAPTRDVAVSHATRLGLAGAAKSG